MTHPHLVTLPGRSRVCPNASEVGNRGLKGTLILLFAGWDCVDDCIPKPAFKRSIEGELVTRDLDIAGEQAIH